MITQREAFVYWLRATGKTYVEISDVVGITVKQAIGVFGNAQRKATAEGLSFIHNPPRIDQKTGSGLCHVADLIPKEPPPPVRGFALLKQMAQEAGLER